MSLQQAQMEGLCLRHPQDLGVQATVTHEMAVNMLSRAHTLAQNTPFSWTYIDKPPEGQMLLLFLSQDVPFPNDGLRYQDSETRYTLPVGNQRELEILELKFGYIPGHDSAAHRVRRRYRFSKGGHPQLVFVHYSRGPFAPINPAMANAPVRNYPLRNFSEPPMFVLGARAGQKAFPPGMQGPGGDRGGSIPPNAMGMGFGGPQAMLAQQNSNMEALERRAQRDRDRSASMSGRAQQGRIEEDDDTDDTDLISVRALSLARYKRNHEFMNEVFMHAAFRNVLEKATEPKPSYSMFKVDELENKISQTRREIEELQAKAAARKAAKDADELAEVSMEGLTATSPDLAVS